LPNGHAQTGQSDFLSTTVGCILCHTLPTGLGTDSQFNGVRWNELPVSTNGSHHAALVASERTSTLPFKIPSLRNLPDKLGMSLDATNSRSGFGFFNDGGVDTLTRFIQDGFGVTDDQATADLIAFLFSFTGSDLTPGSPTDANQSPGLAALDTPAGVGRQITVNTAADSPLIDTMISLAGLASGRVDLVVKGMEHGVARGWYFDPGTGLLIKSNFTYNNANLLYISNGLTFGPDGNLYIPTLLTTNPQTGAILEFNGTTGAYIKQFASTGLENPQDLAFTPAPVPELPVPLMLSMGMLVPVVARRVRRRRTARTSSESAFKPA